MYLDSSFYPYPDNLDAHPSASYLYFIGITIHNIFHNRIYQDSKHDIRRCPYINHDISPYNPHESPYPISSRYIPITRMPLLETEGFLKPRKSFVSDHEPHEFTERDAFLPEVRILGLAWRATTSSVVGQNEDGSKKSKAGFNMGSI